MRAAYLSMLTMLMFTRAPAGAQSQQSDGVTTDPVAVDEILVTGEHSGPGLWMATKDGRTLWILGMHAPLPAKMTWRSREVESILAESQRVVRWVGFEIDLDMGFFARLGALPAVIGAGKNPGGAKLKDVVSPEAYRQWEILKAKYIGRDKSIESLRPAFAALSLRSQAASAAGLSSPEPESVIWPTVKRLAKKHRVKILEPQITLKLKVDKPRELVRKFRQTRLADQECFAQSIARLEDDLDAMKMRANAWATGHLGVLRDMPPPNPSTDCAQLLQNLILSGSLDQELGANETLERARKDIQRVLDESNETWLRTVEEAMREHSSVFALAPVGVLLDAHGPLQTLRHHGYEVIEP